MKLSTIIEYRKEMVLHYDLRHHSTYERLIDGIVTRLVVV